MLINFNKFFYYVKKIFGLTNSYLGIYENWNKALLNSKTYQDKETLKKIKNAAFFANKNSLYFRDGIVFDRYQYSSDVNFCLLLCMLSFSKKKIKILDYGGGLGNIYNQFYKLLALSKLHKKFKFCWDILEQKNISDFGKKFFKKKNLNFFNIDNFNLKNNQYDIIILSAALAFLPSPYKILDNLKVTNFKFLVIDREPFLYKKDDDNDNGGGGGDYLTVLKEAHGLNGSYPCWIFNFKNIKDKLGKNYNLIYKFRSLGGTIYGKFGRADYHGCLFMRNK